MPNSTLFSLDREPLKPASERPEPVVWGAILAMRTEMREITGFVKGIGW